MAHRYVSGSRGPSILLNKNHSCKWRTLTRKIISGRFPHRANSTESTFEAPAKSWLSISSRKRITRLRWWTVGGPSKRALSNGANIVLLLRTKKQIPGRQTGRWRREAWDKRPLVPFSFLGTMTIRLSLRKLRYSVVQSIQIVARLQPVLETQRKQMDMWIDLILSYTQHIKTYQIDATEATKMPLFNNTKINRKNILAKASILVTNLCFIYVGKASPELLQCLLTELVNRGNYRFVHQSKN